VRSSSSLFAVSPATRVLILAALLVILAGCDLQNLPPSPPTAGPQPPTPQATTAAETPTQAAEPSATPESLLPPACKASDLQGIAGWQGATGSLAGAVSVVNKGNAACTLEGYPGVHVVAGDGSMLPVADVEPSDDPGSCCAPLHAPPLVLHPGERGFARFAWRNWCGTQKGPWKLAVALPGAGGQLDVPVLTPDGKQASDTPRCDTSSEASTISMGSFIAPPSP
jgi:hypothetical protein